MTLALGSTIGPYRIVERLGAGGMAAVYKGYQASLARHVAIKVLPAFFAEDEGFRERFRNEALAIAQLRHPNILAIYDYGEDGGLHYIVSEHVDGGTLAQVVGTPLPLERAIATLKPVAAALDYAHQRGIVHRDVKPSNVLISREGTPILADFGLARMMGTLPRLTQTGTAIGTPEYMAPELAEGHPAEAASDQYALGVIAYEMLTGRVPFTADTPLAVLLAQAHQPLPLPRTIEPSLPEPAEGVLLKVLAKAPEDRYPSASHFVSALEQSARPAHLTEVVSRPKASARGGHRAGASEHAPGISLWRRYRYPSVAAAGGAIALLAIVIGLRLGIAPGTPAAVPQSASVPIQAVATTEPTSTGSPSLRDWVGAAPIYEATLDASGSEMSEHFVCSGAKGHPGDPSDGTCSGVDPADGEVRFMDGAIELTSRSRGGGGTAAVGFRRAPPRRYVGEAVLRFAKSVPGFHVTWKVARDEQSEQFVLIDTIAETMRLEAIDVSGRGLAARELTPRIPVPGMRAGRTFSLGVLVDGSRYALFLDGAEVARGTDARLGREEVTFLLQGRAEGPDGFGTFSIEALRIYAAPDGLPRSALLYEATLDAAGSAVAERAVCGGPQCLPDPAYGEVVFVEGAVKLTARSGGAGGGSSVTLRRKLPARYAGEAVLVLEESTPEFTFGWRVTVGERSEHEILIDASEETVRLRYVDGSNAPTSLSFEDLTPSVYVRGMQARRAFSVGVIIDGTSFALFVDGARVAEGTDPRLGREPAPIILRVGAYGPQGSGTMSIRSLRLYAVE